MGSIKRVELINRLSLNEETYFESLIEEACRVNLLTENEVERIQYDCLNLLASKTAKYNGYDSSSIRVEVAQSIMKSNLYTIGLWLKTYPCPDDAINALKESMLTDLYNRGRQKINSMIKAAKAFHSIVLKNMVITDNHIYNATIVDGIKGFFKIYDADFESHDIRITADYPTLCPFNYLVGIEFINEYLKSIYYENMFCQNFSSEDIHYLLGGYDTGYKDLVINIFEFVFTTAIGCIIAQSDLLYLNLSKEDITYLQKKLSGKAKHEIEKIVKSSFAQIKDRFKIMNASLEQYIDKSISIISANIYNAINLCTLDKVFIPKQKAQLNQKVYFSFGEKMDDESYRKIIEEIMSSRFFSDKIAIIKREVKSLADLEDIILDAELSNVEITAILKELEFLEIAALAKKYPLKTDIDVVELRMSEQNLSKCLNEYILSLPLEVQIWVGSTIASLS